MEKSTIYLFEKKTGRKGRSGDAGGKKKEWKYKKVTGILESFIDITK